MASPSSIVSNKSRNRLEGTAVYRSVEYRNGNLVYVNESRRSRHQKPIRRADHEPNDLHPESSQDGAASVPSVMIEQLAPGVESRRVEEPLRRLRHVTSPLKPRAKTPVVMHKAETASHRPHLETYNESRKTTMMLTPPPTPKIERLPTPELPDLHDSVFCECCATNPAVRYCACCGEKMVRY